VVRVVKPEIDAFGANLQAALEGRAAETLAVREAGKAFGRMREFRSSADVLNCDQAPGALHTLINNLSDIPIPLHAGESTPAASTRIGPNWPSRAQA
jgi:hypothetical protein